MYGFQKIKLSFLFLLAIFASGLFVLHTAKAYDYKMGVSRIYNSADIVGTGSQDIYTSQQFDGIAFCTGYYYVNHDKTIELSNKMSLVRQVFLYNPLNSIISGSYMNTFRPGWLINTESITQYGYYDNLGQDSYIFALKADSSDIDNTLSIARFMLRNTGYNDTIYITGNYESNTSLPYSTQVVHTNRLSFPEDGDYAFSVKYYAQPCVPDMPTTSTDRGLINGIGGSTSSSNGAISRIPAIDGLDTSDVSGRPVTLGFVTDTSKHTPASRNLSTFNEDITFDNGIFLTVKEPDKSSAGPAYDQSYYYASGAPKGSGFDLLDSGFVPAPVQTSNQWGINPDTVKVTVSFIGVDKTNFGDAGASCTINITGDALGLSGLGYSWNRNQLGYSVNIDSGTIRQLAHDQCSSLAYITNTGNIDLKRETVANISWDAYDYSNSMIISQDTNTVTYSTPNRIVGTTDYDFNSYKDYPILSMSTDNKVLNNGSTIGYNVPVDNDYLFFTGTDTYAGVNSGKFLIIVTGYESIITQSNNRNTTIPSVSYVFSGSDISKTGFNNQYNRDDYFGSVDFANNLSAKTGMHFTVHFEVEDFVGNKTEQNYQFRTPTYPNAPKSDGLLTPTEQTNQQIDTINIIDNIKQDTKADVDSLNIYDYTGYYPSSTGLITNFEYKSGNVLIGSSTTTPLVVTAYNGNISSNDIVTLTGISFVHNGSASYFTGTPHVSKSGQIMDDYLDTNFTFEVVATNIYGITGLITYEMKVAPSCSESPGCSDPVYVFWGTSLEEAQEQYSGAFASGTAYMNANHWYSHWFAEIKQTGPNFYFTGVVGEPDSKVLYCASTGNDMTIRYPGYTGPQSNPLTHSPADYTGTSLQIVGSKVLLFDVITGTTTANYETENINGADRMTVYVNRPLTGRVFYSVCELTGGSLDVFGCPEVSNHNRTGDINWTKLTDQNVFTMTGWIEGGWMTGIEVNNWGTGFVSNGGGTRKYIRNITGDLQNDINTSGTIAIINRTGATDSVSYQVYWIDNTPVDLTGDILLQQNQSAILTLSGYNTGVLSAIGEPNLIGDDEYILTKFSGAVQPSLFTDGFGSTKITGQDYIDGTGAVYNMIHTIEFAEDREGEICVADRAGNESCIAMNIAGIGTMKELMITVKPAFRPEPSENATGYSILSGDFWFWVKSGSVWTQNYNSAKNSDPKITTNKNGTGLVYIMTPSSGAEYLVVFKGSGTLSAGFTGTWDDTLTEMNFFTGAFADDLSSEYVYKFNNGGTTEHYLKVGDVVANGTGSYDYINDSDFTDININLTLGNNPITKYRYDFDINDVISSMEQSMVLQGWGSHGLIGELERDDIISMTGFVNL